MPEVLEKTKIIREMINQKNFLTNFINLYIYIFYYYYAYFFYAFYVFGQAGPSSQKPSARYKKPSARLPGSLPYVSDIRMISE